jgi:hypothetical protein
MDLAVCVCLCRNRSVSQERFKGLDFGALCDRVFVSVSLLVNESANTAAAAAAHCTSFLSRIPLVTIFVRAS